MLFFNEVKERKERWEDGGNYEEIIKILYYI